jgi:hypothetical protein
MDDYVETDEYSDGTATIRGVPDENRAEFLPSRAGAGR